MLHVEVSSTWSAPPVIVAGPAPVRDHVPLCVSSAVVQVQVPVNVVPDPSTPLRASTALVTSREPKARSTRFVTVTAVAVSLVSTVTVCGAGAGPQVYDSSTRPSAGSAPSEMVHEVPTGRLGVACA